MPEQSGRDTAVFSGRSPGGTPESDRCRRFRGAGTVLLRDEAEGSWLAFLRPEAVLVARRLSEVVPVLEEVETASRKGWYAAGLVCYEAAPAFDRAMQTRRLDGLPLVWFGLYREARIMQPTFTDPVTPTAWPERWNPDISEDDYRRAVTRIRGYIEAGDTYQVNFTFRLRAESAVDPWEFFRRLQCLQPAAYGAAVCLGEQVIVSVSPELFFRLEGSRVVCRPMKGTRKRGRYPDEDRRLCQQLVTSPKERAENVMIVDMVRNDLSRIASRGSVAVPALFEAEKLPTLWQMTSTVECRTSARIPDIFAALFPAASVTGAPKIRTMSIIAELERSPRGVYTGSLGYVAPGRRAQFNVAIRTAVLDRTKVEYGVGGGIVWDSSVSGEYTEAWAKAAVLVDHPGDFLLLETLRWEAESGYFFEREHLDRLMESADYFGFSVQVDRIRRRLHEATASFETKMRRVRVLAGPRGEIRVEDSPLDEPFRDYPEEGGQRWIVRVAQQPVSSEDRFLYHKTTQRGVYRRARQAEPQADDVILWNERGELTESTCANIVLNLGGRLVTPPVSAGLLGGVYRRILIRQGRIQEALLPVEALKNARAVYLINSVRGWIACRIGESDAAG